MTSRVRTPRVLVLAAAAGLAGTPLLAGSLASADAVDTVTFHGGCGVLGSGLGGTSDPDTAQVSVPAGSEIRFTNRLGQPAVLLLNGESAGEVPAGGDTDVVFQRGPVVASMQVSCMLGSPAGTVTVDVVRPAVQPPPPRRSPEPSRPAAPASPPPSVRTGTDVPPPAGGSTPGGVAVPSGGASIDELWSPDHQLPPAGQPGAVTSRDDRDQVRHRVDRHGRWGDELGAADGDVSGTPASAGGAAVDQSVPAQSLAGTAGSADGEGPVGLLALLATVCVVGVSAGAIRTLVTQRANRAEWA